MQVQDITTSNIDQPVQLKELAVKINAEHAACETAVSKCLEHALAAGQLLLRAKDLSDHGNWEAWLGANFEGSERTARAYMRIARNWGVIEAKRQSSAVLGVDGALKLLAGRAPTRSTADPQSRAECKGPASAEGQQLFTAASPDALDPQAQTTDSSSAAQRPNAPAEYLVASPPSTVEKEMATWNTDVEAFARKITALAKDAPRGPWLDANQLSIVEAQLSSAAGSVRATKGYATCSYCDGGRCSKCRQTGFLRRTDYESAPKQ